MKADPETQPLPADLDAETALLASILLDATQLDAVRPELDAADFWSPTHRAIYEAMVGLADAGRALDLVPLSDLLRESGHLEAAGGMAGLSKLIGGGLRLAHVADYAARIRGKAQLRRLIKAGEDLARQAAYPGADAGALAAVAADALERTRGPGGGGLELRRVRDCSADPEPVPLIRRAGDRFGAVLSIGETALLTAAGKIGKSTLARQIATAAGCLPDYWKTVAGLEVAGGPVALISYEDSARRTFESCRLLANPIMPDGLHVLEARGHPLFGVREGEHMQTWPQRLPAWFQIWALLRQARVRLVIVDPVGSAFLGNSASVEAARAFIDALRTEAERAGASVLLIAHSLQLLCHCRRLEVFREAVQPGLVLGLEVDQLLHGIGPAPGPRPLVLREAVAHTGRRLPCLEALPVAALAFRVAQSHLKSVT